MIVYASKKQLGVMPNNPRNSGPEGNAVLHKHGTILVISWHMPEVFRPSRSETILSRCVPKYLSALSMQKYVSCACEVGLNKIQLHQQAFHEVTIPLRFLGRQESDVRLLYCEPSQYA